MNYKTSLVIVLFAFFAAVPKTAFSQDTVDYRSGKFGIALGVFVPKDSSVKSAGASQFNTRFTYDFLSAGRSPLSVGLYSDGSYGKKNGSKATIGGLGLQARYRLGQPGLPTMTYVTAGVGTYSVQVDRPSKSKVDEIRLGGHIGLGVQARSGLFAEVNYRLVRSAKSIDGSGASFSLGFRF
jgi:hypothetical protein